jgi:AcrR family transcriptional regulator
MRLFTERGYDATTIVEIASVASVAELAPRTVTGYFPSKIDMATGAARMARDLGVDPDDLTVAICNAAVGNAIGIYIGLLVNRDPDDDLRRWFLNFLTAIQRRQTSLVVPLPDSGD